MPSIEQQGADDRIAALVVACIDGERVANDGRAPSTTETALSLLDLVGLLARNAGTMRERVMIAIACWRVSHAIFRQLIWH